MANKLDQYGEARRQLFSTNFMKVLAVFLRRPAASLYSGDVLAATGLSRAGANFALRDLTRAGFLQREPRGRLHFYTLVTGNPLVRQLKVLFTLLALGPAVEELKWHALRIVLYGSAATGEDTEESDIDLLIITRDKVAVGKRIAKYTVRERIQPVIHTPQEWALLGSENPVFCGQVERGIVLWESDEAGIQEGD